ncbi:MAG TPA: hypothetical protein VGA03_11745 [Anaerolineales bacterium]
MGKTDKRTRLTIDLSAEIKQRLRLLSASQDISMREYVLETLEEKLARDWAELREQEGLLTLSGQADPVLAELWDNEKDAAYDRL